MMKRLISAALLSAVCSAHAQTPGASAPAALPSTPAKKALAQKIVTLQQPNIENVARSLVEQPAGRMMQDAGRVLQQIPVDKREAVGKAIETDARKYVDESTPIVRERALKLAPSTIGPLLEEHFTEDELKQVLAWLESPVYKKYTQLGPEMTNGFTQKLVTEVRPLVEPRLQALEAKVRADLGMVASGTAAPAASAAPAKAPVPAKKPASK